MDRTSPTETAALRHLTPRSREAGFTLVEMVVALFIFGLLAAAGVGLLAYSVRAQGAAGERLAQVAALRRTNALLSADLAQIVARPTRGAAGGAETAFAGTGGASGTVAIGLVRRGWSNPDARPRPSLQKVEYVRDGERLVRRVYPLLDGAAPLPPVVLLTGVRSLRVRYRLGLAWSDRWDASRPLAVPALVEATLDLGGPGPVRMLFLAGSGRS